MFNSNYFVYITSNTTRSTYYIGVTNDLARRLNEHYHNSGDRKTFAGRYYCYTLIYYERLNSPDDAIAREKQLKGWSRSKKEALIRKHNQLLKSLNNLVLE
ncbi:GIY-YIG nuclease family protein [Pontibacter sp. BT310]|uniref:GIY-YIG nuclease family protein n=1 Tax=Pontibacter populi TaxID=890055 RepID=A0ABS6XDN2_9BACT|nr:MULTISPECIES: GIY-YIG nuclease family protein [Pontibacter]MBJ6119251.1 GIY-YIG nuclease family protein [Pontibacter sp. BT310]MBR0571679.1 GIY-YIG nuclease family protein [Microvirga sp. STS03]MBW3366105.1 GIY-YIG nuclease family protein [Pontibacter populi]